MEKADNSKPVIISYGNNAWAADKSCLGKNQGNKNITTIWLKSPITIVKPAYDGLGLIV